MLNLRLATCQVIILITLEPAGSISRCDSKKVTQVAIVPLGSWQDQLPQKALAVLGIPWHIGMYKRF